MPQTFAILRWDNLQITAPLPDANNVVIAMSGTAVLLNVNGQIATFPINSVANITYIGSAGGRDLVTNQTNFVTLANFGTGGNNTYTASSNYNYVNFYGGDNTFNGTPGKVSDVFMNGGIGDVINKNGATVQVYP